MMQKITKPQLLFAIVVGVAALTLVSYWLQSGLGRQTISQPAAEGTNSDMLADQDVAQLKIADVEYFSGAKGYFVTPEAAGNYPGVVMIHENKGLNDGIRAMARELAKEGYAVLAVDLFEGKVVTTQEDARALTSALDKPKAIENLRAAAAYLRGRGSVKIASLGWCFGGGQSMQLALSGEDIAATVIYYGQLVTDRPALATIKWPVLGIFGDKDQAISVENVNQFDAALDELGIKNEIYMYPGVGHAFANPSGANYAPAETKDAWEKTVAFLKANLADGPASKDHLIRVTGPKDGELVKSPLVVAGEARGNWYFEASFPVQLLDANGTELAILPAQAQGEWMTTEFVPFSVTLSFPQPTTPTGTLVLKKDNPSGLPEYDDELRIPVRFTAE